MHPIHTAVGEEITTHAAMREIEKLVVVVDPCGGGSRRTVV